MQMIDTNVTNNSNGKVTVEFKGEGGEGIAVTVASSTGIPTAMPPFVERKEMMIQVATFGMPNEAFVGAQEAAPPAIGPFSSPKAVS
ncbi:hypothetical protein E0H64_12590 [Rhizobium leguminosarum bv. viciae]|uniref:hypothetical protein n=1 Tax=Rhizobium leguminosarum TaxID=384 RepID=UPI00103DC7DF|nr:hypothetical protein [Rhizobium leguminosarum]MBY5916541.1 hypothetical protein [Rhizobium leguminosarum]TBZ69331.1 hypothetical protein E0H64_12590 [Rhizobium leguminosarum bv. viciae]